VRAGLFEEIGRFRVQDDMPADDPAITPLVLPRIGAAIVGAAVFCPALALPLVLVCLAALGKTAFDESRAGDAAPKVSPQSRERRRDEVITSASQDSFPASDPPSWTLVTGTGTWH
jgi:hypothetical protein